MRTQLLAVRRTKTGQKRAAKAGTGSVRMRDSVRTLKLVLDHQETAVVLVSRNLKVQYLNAAAEALLNTSAQFAFQSHISQLFTDPSVPLESWQRALDDEVSMANRSAQLVLKDGTSLMADYHLTPMLDLDAALLELHPMNRLVRIGRDDQSVNAQETSRQLVRGLAHEVKNPLGGIRGAAQLLQRELEKAAEQNLERPDQGLGQELAQHSPNKSDNPLTEYTQIIIDEADRLGNLVDRMLGPRQAMQLAPTNIHRVLSHVVNLVTAEFDMPLEIRRDFDPSLPRLNADYDALVQALLNILRNAAQALVNTPNPTISLRTRSVRQFTIGTKRHRLALQLDIEDNGPGIPQEIYDRVFYPMISGRPDGTGLGLAITQTIVSNHRGLLELTSRPGQTCFSVYLPMDTQSMETQ